MQTMGKMKWKSLSGGVITYATAEVAQHPEKNEKYYF